MAERKITFEIKEDLGTLSKGPGEYEKKVRIISWNHGADKVDIRSWAADDERMSKGITLTKDEAKNLLQILQDNLEVIEGL